MIQWMIAASPHDPAEVSRRYQAIEDGHKHETGIDGFMADLARRKRVN